MNTNTMTMTELLAATVTDLGLDVTTNDGRQTAIKLALRLGQAADLGRQQAQQQAINACAAVFSRYEAQSNACSRFSNARRGQIMSERATGAYMCVSTLKTHWRTGSDAGQTA